MADAGSPGNGRLLKILCLHGYRQNGQLFREKTGAFRKAIKKFSDLVFVTAPNVVPPIDDNGGDDDSGSGSSKCGWWFSREDDVYQPDEPTKCCKGYEESLEVIKKTFQEEGPFDGILGFSQGAAMVSLLCGLQEQGGDECPIKFNFAILVAGFKSRSSPHDHLYTKKITVPTLHVYGSTDKVIAKQMSVELLEYFDQPQLVEHEGGHFVPASSLQKKSYLEFLERQHRRRFQNTEQHVD